MTVRNFALPSLIVTALILTGCGVPAEDEASSKSSDELYVEPEPVDLMALTRAKSAENEHYGDPTELHGEMQDRSVIWCLIQTYSDEL